MHITKIFQHHLSIHFVLACAVYHMEFPDKMCLIYPGTILKIRKYTDLIYGLKLWFHNLAEVEGISPLIVSCIVQAYLLSICGSRYS